MVKRAIRVVVVGGGVGGLVSAIELARQGMHVVVLERAARVGGKMRQVHVGGREIDAGPTVMTMRWVFDEIWDAAGASLDADLTLRRAHLLARHAWGSHQRLDLFADVDASAAAIADFAGKAEADGYRRFCAYAKDIYDAVC